MIMKNNSSRAIKSVKKQQGNISIIFALSLIMIISIIIISANTAYLAMSKSRLEHVIESSVVAIGLAGTGSANNPLTISDYREIVSNILAASFPDSYKSINFTINPPVVSGDPYTIDAEVDFNFIAANWLAWTNVESNSNIKLNSKMGIDVVQGNIEIAMVMDNSGSMYADINTLKDSAKLFINQLIDHRSNAEQVYISIVPFSSSVNIGKENLNWINNNLSADAHSFGACTQYRYNSPPASSIITNAILPPISVAGSASKKFPGYAAGTFSPCAETPILGLTNNKSLLLSKVTEMVASGATDGDQGMLWGWRTLTKEWQGLWSSAIDRPLANTEVKKVAIFFSDGASISNEREIFLPTCAAMKADGIDVYTIQFSSPNISMQTCSSDIAGKRHYFYANNRQQLKQAFIDISKSVGFELKLKKL